MKNLILLVIGFIIATSAAAESDLTLDELREAFSVEPTPITNLERQKKLANQFHYWDGSHRKLERYIKNKLNDSDSYQHIETRYNPDITPMQVGTKFRAKNPHGAQMVNYVLAEVSDEGEVFRILKWLH